MAQLIAMEKRIAMLQALVEKVFDILHIEPSAEPNAEPNIKPHVEAAPSQPSAVEQGDSAWS